MKPTVWSIVALAVGMGSASAGCATGGTTIDASLDRNVVHEGQNFTVFLEVTNRSGETVFVNTAMAFAVGDTCGQLCPVRLEIRRTDGSTIAPVCAADPSVPLDKDFVLLKPGGAISAVLGGLAECFDLREGTYHIRVVYKDVYGGGPPPPKGARRFRDEIRSPPIRLVVTKKGNVQREAP